METEEVTESIDVYLREDQEEEEEDGDEDEEGDDIEELQSAERSERNTKKKESIRNSVVKYAELFKSGRRRRSRQPQEYQDGNLLVDPPVKDEGRRDKKTVKIERYFGHQSRQDFFDRSQWVQERRNIMSSEVNVAEKVFMNPKDDYYDLDFAFAPRRCDDFFDEYENSEEEEEGEEDENDKTALDGQPTFANPPTDLCATVDTMSTIESVSTLHTSLSTIEKGSPTSPRTRFIGNCINSHINPRASLILRKHVSTELNLRHQGMGDKMGVIFAESLKELPFVHTLDLTDNNLTDAGLHPIIEAVISQANLTDLNLSQNVVDGDSAKALATYLSSPNCALKRLVLQSADVDDEECQMFVASLMLSNKLALEELDLSRNLIGKSENLNTVMPEVVTGGEAIADLLAANTCKLSTLKLAWNMIRLDGAIELAKSLADACYLTYLDISYNSLGKTAGEILGKSLISNESLTYLNISDNSINSTACFTICVGLEENKTMRNVIFDGNPIGQLGFTMATQIPMAVGGRLHVSTSKCNTSIRDADDSKIDINDVAAHYELDMSRPFHRAIMFKLLSFASKNRSILLESYSVQTNSGIRHIKLKRNLSNEKYDSLSPEMKNEVSNLLRIQKVSEDEDMAEMMFLEHDEDSSGGLDVNEVETLVNNLGICVPREVVELTVKRFDIDGGGVLELSEFLEFLRAQKVDAAARIRELTEGYTITTRRNPKKRYIPPKAGRVQVLVCNSFLGDGAQVVSSEDHDNIMKMVKSANEGRTNILEFGIKGTKLRAKEAFAIYHFMLAEIRTPAIVLEKILPHLVNFKEARIFIQQTIQKDGSIMKHLRQTMGSCISAILGHFNGWYYLDLSRENDRMCLIKLLEQSQAVKEARIAQAKAAHGLMANDISQLGDWSCFRNVVVDGKPSIITPEMYNPMGKRGIIHFDFCGAEKPDGKVSVLSDQRVVNSLIYNNIISQGSKLQTLQQLAELKKQSEAEFRGNGCFDNKIDIKKAKSIQLHMLYFYSQLLNRPKYVRRGQKAEEIKHSVEPKNILTESTALTDAEKSDSSDEEDFDSGNDAGGGHGLNPSPSAAESIIKLSSDKKLASHSKPKRQNVKATRRGNERTLEHSSTSFSEQEMLAEDLKNIKNDNININNKAYACWKLVNAIFETFKESWLRCRHIAAIMGHFLQGHMKRSKYFGSYRVELIVLLFHRLTDVQNFNLIMRRLMPFEVACLYCRLGYLHLFNPMKPEGCHFLNIANREERIVTKILAALSTIEPGENWLDETFQWELTMDPIPGWVLTQTWMTDEGMPPRGFLYVNYYSGEGKQLSGNIPNVGVRKSFFHLVGIDEEDLFSDDANFILEKKTKVFASGLKKEITRIADRIFSAPPVGVKHLLEHKTLWQELMAPNNSSSARIARGEKVLSVFNDIRRHTGRDPFVLQAMTSSKISAGKKAIELENSKANSK